MLPTFFHDFERLKEFNVDYLYRFSSFFFGGFSIFTENGRASRFMVEAIDTVRTSQERAAKRQKKNSFPSLGRNLWKKWTKNFQSDIGQYFGQRLCCIT